MLTACYSDRGGGLGSQRQSRQRSVGVKQKKRKRERSTQRGTAQLSSMTGLQGSPWAWISNDGGLGERV